MLVVSLVAALFVAGAKNFAATQPDLLKVGFITTGSINDFGYNYAHNQGRLFLQSALPNQVETSIVENIPESAEVERVMEKMVAQGTRLIFSTSYGFFDPALRVVARHPNVIILQCGRESPNPIKNFATYNARAFEPMYVAGLVAGKVTKTNRMGFVAAHPVPVILQEINAFTLGARSVNPKVTVRVVWTNNWCDPPSEAEATKGLIEQGVDVLAMHLDSPIVVAQTAEKHGVYCVGYHTDLHKYAPKGFLTGAQWNWGPLYVSVVKSIENHTWKAADTVYGLDADCMKVAPFGPAVPKDVQAQALAVKDKIAKHQFAIFQGPLIDRDRKVRLPAGTKAEVSFINRMDFFVPGVEGILPRQ
jgi:basic membrane lipoprotein Med (substrate-binding protein (PBP1-ABC) superfamily)